MKKLIYAILIFYILLFPKDVGATSPIAESSANIQKKEPKAEDNRALVLQKYLEQYDSPLAPYAEKFVSEADKYQIPWTWVPAISGIESTFGKRIPYNSYNAWGWANGEFAFKGWDDGIEIVTKTLKENYVARGADTIAKIAPIYAPPSTTWALKVTYFIGKIEVYQENISQLPISL